MAFLDGDFVNGQNAQTRIISLPVRRFEPGQVDGLHGFFVDRQMLGDLLNRQDLAQLENVPRQAMRHAFSGIAKGKLLGHHA